MIRAGVGDALEWRTLIVLEEGAEAEVWEEWVSGDDETEGLFNGVTEIIVGEGATLHYVGAQALNDSTWVFANQRAVVARDATLDWSALAFGSARGKVWMETKLDGRGSSRARDGRLRRRTAASTSTSTRSRSTPLPTRSPTSRSAACWAAARARCGAG